MVRDHVLPEQPGRINAWLRNVHRPYVQSRGVNCPLQDVAQDELADDLETSLFIQLGVIADISA